MGFPERLKAARRKTGLTQSAVAKKLNITPQSYAQYEHGTRRPKQDTLSKMADALQLGYGYAQNGEPYFYCFVDTVQHGDENEIFNGYQYNDAMKSDHNSKSRIPVVKAGPELTIDANFDVDEYTEEELEEIRQFAEFVKSKRKNSVPEVNAAHHSKGDFTE